MPDWQLTPEEGDYRRRRLSTRMAMQPMVDENGMPIGALPGRQAIRSNQPMVRPDGTGDPSQQELDQAFPPQRSRANRYPPAAAPARSRPTAAAAAAELSAPARSGAAAALDAVARPSPRPVRGRPARASSALNADHGRGGASARLRARRRNGALRAEPGSAASSGESGRRTSNCPSALAASPIGHRRRRHAGLPRKFGDLLTT